MLVNELKSIYNFALNYKAKYGSRTKRLRSDNSSLKPTKTEYATATGKEFLSVLGVFAQAIPIPGVGAVVTVATNIIKLCEEGDAILEKANELKLRVKTLMMVVVNELKGKKRDDISDKLMQDIDALQDGFQDIRKTLDDIMSQRRLALLFFKVLNEEKINKCMNRLDILIERFDIAQQINHADLLYRLENEIINFYSMQSQTLNHIGKGVDGVNVKVERVIAILQRDSSVAAPLTSTCLWAAIPAKKSLFFGRDSLVLNIVAHLVSPLDGRKPHHICILGPGGIGKTSTALAVMEHPDVQQHFPGNRRVWVPCVKVTSFASFLDTLATSLGITQTKGVTVRGIIISVLESAPPLVLLLDNFETPWNVDGGRTEAEQVLRDIDQIPHVSIFVTMRSSAPPCVDLFWHSIHIKAVDVVAAHQILATIYPDIGTDSEVPELLQLVGCVPLAITLMASLARNTGLSAKYLIDQYKKSGTTMLSQGSDAEHNMDICISLSVDSLPMRRNPEAQRLLSALSMLPIGTTYEVLSSWWVPDSSNTVGALQILRETALLELQGSTVFVLPVVQRYVLHPSRFDSHIRNSMIASACAFLESHKPRLGDNSYKQDVAALAAEEGNLEAVLLQATTPSTEVMRGLLALAWYQTSARPRTSIIGHALTLAQQLGDHVIHGTVLLCYGYICHDLNRYVESRKHFTEARSLLLAGSDTKQAAHCLLELVYSYQASSLGPQEYLTSYVAQAESEFTLIGDKRGIAQCEFARGTIAYRLRHWDRALDLFFQALDTFMDLKEPLMFAKCLGSIGGCYYWQEDFNKSKTWSEWAMQELVRLDASGVKLDALLQLGCIYNALGDHTLALETMTQCLHLAKACGAMMTIGCALEEMGIALGKMGRREEAQNAFQEALDVSPPGENEEDHVRYSYWLRKLRNTNTVPSEEERRALQNSYPLKALYLIDFWKLDYPLTSSLRENGMPSQGWEAP